VAASTAGGRGVPAADPLSPFSPAVAEWFRGAFEAATPAQAQGWASIAAGRHTLIHAPTGSGKTLAAFLWCLDRLTVEPRPVRTKTAPGTVRVLYVSPLKALIYDVERNLRAPLAGIRLAAQRLGLPVPDIEVGVRTGDTPSDERRHLVRNPPDILITTPESLYLILTSQAAEILRGVEHVIVDEVHAVAGSKRGAHLAVSLERLECLTVRPPQRIGLSATQRPVETIARFLGGAGPGRAEESRDVAIVDAGSRKPLELSVRVPVEDMTRPGGVDGEPAGPGGPVGFGGPVGSGGAAAPPAIAGGPVGGPVGLGAGGDPEARQSIWPAIHPRILELIREHHSTIVFCNSRRLAERLANKLNELAGEELVRAHHGSLAREQRAQIEEALKAGRLPAIVATSSLELGIDMGAVDLVIQIESPASVASGLQRVGRAGHQVGEPSRGVIFPKFRGDLLEAAVVTARMHEGAVEETRLPRNPLDVLAQQLVAMTVREAWDADELYDTVRRAAPYETLTRDAFEAVLGMLAGAYPSDEFAELKARVVWDRETGRVEGRRDARTVAVTSGGTIPDRGLYPVFLVGEAGTPGRRVGELDEEMVYESRVGEVIALGATSWRIEEIRPDRVVVSPAPGVPGKIPFWHGDGLGRPIELGRAIGAFVRELEGDLSHGEAGRSKARRRLLDHHDLDDLAAENVIGYLDEEREIAGHLPTDRRIVVERFRDELGDWRVVMLTPFGGRVHAPWCLAIEARLEERFGFGLQTIWSDDGIAIRLPEGEVPGRHGGPGATAAGADGDGSAGDLRDLLFPSADEVEDLVVGRLASSAMFAARFRENAARALLLPRRRPGSRTPLWQQRQRSAGLLAVASRYGSFPIIVETYRECLADLFDLPALRDVLSGISRRDIEVREVETVAASPFAGSLLFDYLAAYMYEGDAPLAERRAGALALDRELLRELLGQEELRDLIDPAALADLELALQALVPERAARNADQLHDMLRRLGDLSVAEVASRIADPVAADTWLASLAASRRAISIRVEGEARWIAIEDSARYRDALGVPLPVGVPAAFLGGTGETAALEGLVARWARTHGPFHEAEVARRWGLAAGRVEAALERLLEAGTILRGEFRPNGTTREWCDPDVLRQLRRRSLARLRKEVEPVEQVVLARFLPAWQGVASLGDARPSLRHEGALERLAEVIDQLSGMPIPASVLERDVLPVRVPGYQPRLLDELGAMGEVAWVGRGSLGRDDGRIVLYRPGREVLRELAAGELTRPDGALHDRLRERLAARGASFYRELAAAAGTAPEREVLDALWDLVWAGEITNDTFAPLRALRWRRPSGERRPRPGRLQTGPPEAVGRWSLTGDAAPGAGSAGSGSPGAGSAGSGSPGAGSAGSGSPGAGSGAGGGPAGSSAAATARLHSFVTVLLERHGVLTREAVASEEVAGGFSGVYPVLRAMEESGRIRRGYFVEGLGAAQFALPGAVDRMRAMREPDRPDDAVASRGGSGAPGPAVLLLAAADPANPYGAALAWPRRDGSDRRPLQRAAGAYVAMVEGVAAVYLERGGHSLQMLPAAEDGQLAGAALTALRALVDDGRVRELVITRVDGEAVGASRWREALQSAGFVAGYRGMALRAGDRRVVAAGRGLSPDTAEADSYWRRGGAYRGGGAGRGGGRGPPPPRPTNWPRPHATGSG
jgi:ATP-dependent Lhr-like helicase